MNTGVGMNTDHHKGLKRIDAAHQRHHFATRFRFTVLAVLALAVCAGASAQTEEIIVTAEPSPTPAKGMSQSSVVNSFGEPAEKRAPVGGGSRLQPPITRWDYEGFTVVFEHGHVVDSVLKGNPAPIKVRDGLRLGMP